MNYVRATGVVMVLVLGCDSESDTGESTGETVASTGTGSETTGETESSIGGAGSSGTTGDPASSSSGDEGTTGSSTGAWETGAWETGDPSDSDTDNFEPSDCINDDIALENVVLEMTTHRVLGEDVVATFDAKMGSVACYSNFNGPRVVLDFGPTAGSTLSRLILGVYDGPRSYDLATDPGPPASGQTGLLELSYSLEEGPTTYSFGTDNQAGVGTVNVTSLPGKESPVFAFEAAGHIAGVDGWEFDLSFTATLPE